MSKDAETGVKVTATGGDVASGLRGLHREYLASLRALASDGERQANEALERCMAELGKIEDEVATSLRKAADERDAALKASEHDSQHHRTYEHAFGEHAARAGERAEAARQAYLAAWKAIEQAHEAHAKKSRRDYVARVQRFWGAVDLDQLDEATTGRLVEGFHALYTDASHG